MPAAPRVARLSRKAPGSDDVVAQVLAVEEAGVALEGAVGLDAPCSRGR